MRVLILSAFLAYATAAPSGLIAPILPYGPVAPISYSAVAIPASVPTISPGDIQAAAIDAHVQVQDLARQAADAQIQATDAQILASDLAKNAADKAQEYSVQATENVKDQSTTTLDLVNEKTGEAFWSAEDKKWQAIDALKTAEAQIDGAVASNAPLLAKSAVGVLPYAAGPVIAPISPVLYPGFVAPYQVSSLAQSSEKSEASVKTVSEQSEASLKTVSEQSEASLKTVSENVEEKSEKTDAGEAVVKTAEIAVNDKLASAPAGYQAVGVTNVYRYDVVNPGVSQLYAQPWVKFVPGHGIIAPTFVKTVW